MCYGGIAQLGERLHGMQEVSGSIPLTSTNKTKRRDEFPSFRFECEVMKIETLTVGQWPEERKQPQNVVF